MILITGDVTRGIVAKGKKAEGRDDKSGYKFVSASVFHVIFVVSSANFNSDFASFILQGDFSKGLLK